MKFCPNCGTERHYKLNYCTQCAFDFNSFLQNKNNQCHNDIIVDNDESITIPKKHYDEIKRHINFRHDCNLKNVRKAIDENTYIVEGDCNKLFQVKIGGVVALTSSEVIDENKQDSKTKGFNPIKVDGTKVNNPYLLTGFILGIVSIFLAGIGIIPLTGIIISVIGLVRYDSLNEKNYWMGIVGIILNSIYFLVNMYMNGHIG